MNNSLPKKIARIISTLFIPPAFTLIIFSYLAFSIEPNLLQQLITFSTASLFGFVSPVTMFVVLRQKGMLVDLDASLKEERAKPYLYATVFYAIGLLPLIIFKVNIISIAFWFCYISNTILITIINKYWKISAHAMGSSGAFAFVLYFFGLKGLPFVIVPAAVGWSRIKLKCHTSAQVFVGIIIGLVSTYFQILIILKYF